MKITKLFFWTIFIQIFILNNIQLSGYINPYYYLIFILYIPSKYPKFAILLLSFLIGFVIDLFSQSYGIHTFTSVLIAYLKIVWTSKIAASKDSEELIEINNLSISNFITLSCYFILIHHFTLFFLERLNLYEIASILSSTIASSIFTLFLFIIHKLFSIKKT